MPTGTYTRKKIAKVLFICPECSKEKYLLPCHARVRKYCSSKCAAQHHKPNCECNCCKAHRGELTGENHPMYGKRGKDSPNYGNKQTSETKEQIRQAILEKYKDDKYVKKREDALIIAMNRPDVRKKLRESKLGNKNPSKRAEVKEKIRKSVQYKFDTDIEYRQRVYAGTILGMSKPDARKRYLEGYAKRRNKYTYSNTSIEIKMQNELTLCNIDFQLQKAIIGIPDIFIEPNICIFCDGDYWHNRPGSHERDTYVNKTLTAQGYKVLRFWEHAINASSEKCVQQIIQNI